MNYLLLLSAVPFIILSIFLYIRYRHYKVNYENLSEKYKDVRKDIREMNKSLRKGYYEEKVNFCETKGGQGDPYDCVVYIEELDRYTNGDSKIKLTKVEVINGFHSNLYSQARSAVERKFCTIKPTKDIEWLESEGKLKEKRREKLNLILEKIEEKEKTI